MYTASAQLHVRRDLWGTMGARQRVDSACYSPDGGGGSARVVAAPTALEWGGAATEYGLRRPALSASGASWCFEAVEGAANR